MTSIFRRDDLQENRDFRTSRRNTPRTHVFSPTLMLKKAPTGLRKETNLLYSMLVVACHVFLFQRHTSLFDWHAQSPFFTDASTGVASNFVPTGISLKRCGKLYLTRFDCLFTIDAAYSYRIVERTPPFHKLANFLIFHQ